MSVLVKDVSKQFGSFLAVDQVSLKIESGSLVALLGPSGSGKSTLLRLISGLEVPDSGQIWLTDKEATYQDVQDRNIGFVFQHYALFKHMTIRQNIGFGLEIRKAPKAKIRQRVEELLELIQLQGLGNRYPAQLSGGQRQRVALARALAAEPKVLLLDEPFGALDAKVRKDLRTWLRRLHDEVHVTTIFVTHDQEEAMEVANEIVVMNQGRVEQVGTPAEVYDQPATPFVMSFIGPVNVLSNTEIFPRNGHRAHEPHAQVFLRPHDVVIETSPGKDLTPAKVNHVVHLGWEIQVELALADDQVITAHLTRERYGQLQLQPRQRVYVTPKQVKSFSLDYFRDSEYTDQIGSVKGVWLILTDTYSYESALKQALEVAAHANTTFKGVFVIEPDATGEIVNELEDKGWLSSGALPNLQASLLEGYHALARNVLDKVQHRASQAGLGVETAIAEAPLADYIRGLLSQRGAVVIVSCSKALASRLGKVAEQVEWIEETAKVS